MANKLFIKWVTGLKKGDRAGRSFREGVGRGRGRRNGERLLGLVGGGRVANFQKASQGPSPGGVVGEGCLHSELLEDHQPGEHPGGCPVKGREGGGHCS